MSSKSVISNISEHFCDWRSHISKGDCLQAYDGTKWFAATVHAAKMNADKKELLVGYDNYSTSYDFWCSIQSKQIRPTIGFLRKKIMVPQAKRIHALSEENTRLKRENEKLKAKSKFNEKEYKYLAVRKLTPLLKNDDSSFDFMKDVEDQEEIEDVLMKHVSVLSEWNKITKELSKINAELNEKVHAHDDDDNDFNIKDLVHIQTLIEKKSETQQQRLESSQNSIIMPVMKRKFKIDRKIKEYSDTLEKVKQENDYDANCSTRKECNQLLESLYDLNRYCNQQISKANELNKRDVESRNKICTLQDYISQYSEYAASYFDLLKGYQKFQVLNKEYIINSVELIDESWNKIESLWYKWNCEDILLWMQHKMKWLNKNAVPNCLDFNTILEDMQNMQMNGMSLSKLNKTDLLNIGFKIHSHRSQLLIYIKSLVTKNKIPNDESNDEAIVNYHHYNDNQEGEESGHTMTGDQVMNVPQEYKCALSNILMTDPVICGHNNKIFEKTEIYKYIKDNGMLPIDIDGAANSINRDDESSFLLFDDINLKIEIQQFKQEYNI